MLSPALFRAMPSLGKRMPAPRLPRATVGFLTRSLHALAPRQCCYSTLAGLAPWLALVFTPAQAGSARPGWLRTALTLHA
jgi:hypothetical protein